MPPVATALTTAWPADVNGCGVRYAVGAFPFGSALPDCERYEWLGRDTITIGNNNRNT
jgi:hypothetical protein